MAKNLDNKTWYFWFSTTEYGNEEFYAELNCKKPGRTLVAKVLEAMFNKGKYKRYGWTIDKSNLG